MASFHSPQDNHIQHTALELLSICYDEPTTLIQDSRSPSYTTPIHSPRRVSPPNTPTRINRDLTHEYDPVDRLVTEIVLISPEKQSLVPCVESPCISTECRKKSFLLLKSFVLFAVFPDEVLTLCF